MAEFIIIIIIIIIYLIFFLLLATVHIYNITIAPLLELVFCVWGAEIYQYNFLASLLWVLLGGKS